MASEFERFLKQAAKAAAQANQLLRSGVVDQAVHAAEATSRLLRSRMLEAVERNSESLQQFAAWVEQNSLLLRRTPEFVDALQQATQRFREAFRNALPPNWGSMSFEEVFGVVEVIEQTGFSLAWAPREEIVKALLEAEPDDRDQLLLGRRDEVVDDLDTLLDEIRNPRLRDIPAGLRASLKAYREGHSEAAQALTTVLFTALLHGPLRFKGHGKARKNFGKAYPTDSTIEHFRLASITLAGEAALDDFNPMTCQPRSERYNRHASAHSYLREQYNDLAALVSLLLVMTLTRECEYWLTEQGGMPAESSGSASRPELSPT